MTTLQPQPATTRVIGIDVGGTKIAAAVVARDGSIEARLEQSTEVGSEHALLAQLDAIVGELRSGADVAASPNGGYLVVTWYRDANNWEEGYRLLPLDALRS